MKCNSCKQYTYYALKRCNSCGLPLNYMQQKDYTQTTITYNKIEETNIDKQLNKIYSQPNERFLNPVGHYKGVKNSEAFNQ